MRQHVLASGSTQAIALLFFATATLAGFGAETATANADFLMEEINFRTHDGFSMFGKLVLPRSTPRAIVISVQTAEGATVDMKRPLGKGKTFNYYDLYRTKLTEMRIGHFSYEGRGIRMGGDLPRYEEIDHQIYNTSTLENKVRDILAAIATLRRKDGLKKTPILLMGASEGTLLAAEAAARQPDEVSGLVLYGVLATNLRETFRYIMSGGAFLKYEKSMDLDGDGDITKTEWDEVVKDTAFSQADTNKDGIFNVKDMEVLTKKYLDAIDANDFEVLQEWAKTSAAVAVPDNWFKDHFQHQTSWDFLSKLDIPVGCFHGDMDAMTPIAAVRQLEAKAMESGLTKMEFHYCKGLDHSLNVGRYFANGKLPQGHQAIFKFIDHIAPKSRE